jgi:TonB family protein
MISTGLVANLVPLSLQVLAVVAAASLLPWLFRLDAAGVRYAYWRTVALLCLTLPWIQPYRAALMSTETMVVTATTTTNAAVVAGARAVAQLNWGSLLLSVLAIGVIVRLGWLAAGLIRLQRLRQEATRHALAAVENELQQILGTRAVIRYMPGVEQPLTFGLLRPIVMLPENLRVQPRDIQQAVLGHELLHVDRRDWAWLIVEEIAVCLFWFHPASWWVASQIQQAREEVVDELAIQLTGRRKTYVEALLTFSDATSVVPTAAFARRRHLFRRIALVSKESVMSSRRIVATCAAMALIVGTGCWFSVAAFPLRADGQTRTHERWNPGPLELKAHKVTPENPIPRRIQFETPVLPQSVASSHGKLGIKVTLDDAGGVAEARVVQLLFEGQGFSIDASETELTARGTRGFEGTAKTAGASSDSVAVRETIETFVDAALDAVRQWRYEPPFAAPLTFSVDVMLGAPVMVFQRASESDALRVGGNIKPPKKIRDVRPVYPPIARESNVTGVVIMEARIGVDGSVEEARVLKSIPLLDQAALDAVKQWQFEPTLMNGEPTPVIMTVTVNFTLQ